MKQRDLEAELMVHNGLVKRTEKLQAPKSVLASVSSCPLQWSMGAYKIALFKKPGPDLQKFKNTTSVRLARIHIQLREMQRALGNNRVRGIGCDPSALSDRDPIGHHPCRVAVDDCQDKHQTRIEVLSPSTDISSSLSLPWSP